MKGLTKPDIDFHLATTEPTNFRNNIENFWFRDPIIRCCIDRCFVYVLNDIVGTHIMLCACPMCLVAWRTFGLHKQSSSVCVCVCE